MLSMGSTFWPVRFALSLAIAVAAAGCAAPAPPADGFGCRSFGHIVDMVRWSADGELLAVGEMNTGRILLVEWPTFEVQRQFENAAGGDGWSVNARSLALDAEHRLTWLETLNSSDEDEAYVAVWRADASGDSQRLGYLPHPRFSDFYWVGDELSARERGLDDRTRLVQLVPGERDLAIEPSGSWESQLSEAYWASRDGDSSVYDTHADVGEPTVFVVRTADGQYDIEIPAGGLSASISADGATLAYRDVSTADFMAYSLLDETTDPLTNDGDFWEGELSPAGPLAVTTAYAPGVDKENALCVFQPD